MSGVRSDQRWKRRSEETAAATGAASPRTVEVVEKVERSRDAERKRVEKNAAWSPLGYDEGGKSR